MSTQNLCNDGRCKKVRMGEPRHPKHLDKKTNPKDKDHVLRSPTKVQILFGMLVILGTTIMILTNDPNENAPLKDFPILKTIYTAFGLIMFGLAFALLNVVRTVRTEDRIRRIEEKLDRILEHRDNVIQNK